MAMCKNIVQKLNIITFLLEYILEIYSFMIEETGHPQDEKKFLMYWVNQFE